MRTIASWYCGFLIFCALLGFVSGLASATTGLDFSTRSYDALSANVFGQRIPTPNTILMMIAAALMTGWARLRGLAPFQKT